MEHADYVRKKVDPLLDKIVAGLITDRPEDVIGYMIRFLDKPEPSLRDQEREVRHNIEELQIDIESLESKISENESNKASLPPVEGAQDSAPAAEEESNVAADPEPPASGIESGEA
ncbi:unnamed protein product [Amoebophrya sp. A120]|nr:unnamed protein product [Amoebophrya sp. A120]|eukprot:GSA120T00017520001.1